MKYINEIDQEISKVDKPGPRDPRRTPAPKKDQKKGIRKISPIVLRMTKARLLSVKTLQKD